VGDAFSLSALVSNNAAICVGIIYPLAGSLASILTIKFPRVPLH